MGLFGKIHSWCCYPVLVLIMMMIIRVLPAGCTTATTQNDTVHQQDDFEEEEEDEGNYYGYNETMFNKSELDRMWETALTPRASHYRFIVLSVIVFVAGLVGNALVCLAVYRNHTMRTVTNYFIVNLAIADLLVIIICLPSTVLWDVTQTWFLGAVCCKIVLYLQTVTVGVSVLTLTFISMDRWYAICRPFRFKSTMSRAKTAILIIWMISLIIDLPELWVLDTEAYPKARGELVFTQCKHTWDLKTSQLFFLIFKLGLLYTIPLVLMSVAYYQIVRVLAKSNIPGHSMSTRISQSNAGSTAGSMGAELSSQIHFANPEGQVIKSRRKAAKMLVAVVLMFAVCCLPPHLLDIYRIIYYPVPNSETMQTMSCLVHLAFYANSAINPLIYNFMSGKFRKEFSRTFCCSTISGGSHNRDEYRMMAARKSSQSGGGPSAALRVPSTSRLLVVQSTDKII